MVFNTGAALLDAIVLAVVSREQEGTYGYKITQDVRKVLNVSESTMYPVLRRLQKDECLEVYDMQFDGRNRRYYKVTEKGMAQLNYIKSNGRTTQGRLQRCSREVQPNEPYRVYEGIRCTASWNFERRKRRSNAVLQ